MVAPIVRMRAPDPLTLVLDLKTPINPFPSWLASPYGLKVVSPALVRAHTKGKDHGKAWLATHCAGTGPYDLTQVVPGQRYELQANAHYWAAKPYFKHVVFSMIPSFSTQALQLRSGGLDMMTHGLQTADVTRFESDPRFTVSRLPGISAINLWINPHKPNLQSAAVRRAIGLALNRQALVRQVYGSNATVYNGLFAPGTLPPQHDYKLPYDAAQAKSIVNAVSPDKRTVSLQYTSDDATNQQIAGIIAQQLGSAGFKVTQRGLPETEVFNFTTAGEQAPGHDRAAPESGRRQPVELPAAAVAVGPEHRRLLPALRPGGRQGLRAARAERVAEPSARPLRQGGRHVREDLCAGADRQHQGGDRGAQGHHRIGVERQGLWTVDIEALRGSPTAAGRKK